MDYYEELDPETNLTYRIPMLKFMGAESADDFARRNRDTLVRALAGAIEVIVNHDLPRVPIFTVEEVDVVFYLDRSEIKHSIKQCIQYFTEIEEYEECVKLNYLKNKEDEKAK